MPEVGMWIALVSSRPRLSFYSPYFTFWPGFLRDANLPNLRPFKTARTWLSWLPGLCVTSPWHLARPNSIAVSHGKTPLARRAPVNCCEAGRHTGLPSILPRKRVVDKDRGARLSKLTMPSGMHFVSRGGIPGNGGERWPSKLFPPKSGDNKG